MERTDVKIIAQKNTVQVRYDVLRNQIRNIPR